MPRAEQQPQVEPYLPNLDESRYSSSMERGLAILSCFTPRRPVLGIKEISGELGMAHSTTHRYVSTLAELGYLEQGPRRKYHLTLAVTRLGMSALNATSLREHVHPYLQDLRRQTSYTTAIAVLDRPEILYVERLPSNRRGPSARGPAPGSRLPAYCTAMGKVLLASLPPPEQQALIAELQLKRHGPNTITSKTALRAELKSMAENIAVNDQELTPDLHAIAAPVRDESEVVAAICIAAPTSLISLDDMVQHLTPHLRSTADRISARLGYRRADERDTSPPSPQG
jgi:IclR family transcriptional regulator, pca regulon regulatory protein